MADIVTQAKAAQVMGRSQTTIRGLQTDGRIKKYRGGKVDLDEIRAYYADVAAQKTVKKGGMSYADARTFKEVYKAKLAELEYKEKMGQLIQLQDIKATLDKYFGPFSKNLDELHIELKARFPDVNMEAIAWLENHINELKQTVQDIDFLEGRKK